MRLCHILAAGLVAVLGCASQVGWSPTEARVCAPKDPAQVCSVVAPDFGHVITVGDVELLPGECAVLADTGRGGMIRVETRDPRGERARRWVRVPQSKITIIEVREHGQPKLHERHRCDRTPVSLGSSAPAK